MKKPKTSVAGTVLIIIRFLTRNFKIQFSFFKCKTIQAFVNFSFLLFPPSAFPVNWNRESVFDTPKLMLTTVRNIS